MGVTAIKQIRNTTPAEVLVRSREAKKTVTLPPFQGVGVDIWIPWCNSLDDLRNGHVLEIYQIFELIGIRVYFYIWQKAKQVSFSTDGSWSKNGTCVPINCATGGERLLTIGANGDAFTFE